MKPWCRTAGVIFLSAGAVYFGQAGEAAAENQATSANGSVRVIADNGADPAGLPAEAAVDAANDPFAAPLAVDQGQPLREGDVVLTDAGTVTIHVNDTSLVDVLRMLSMQSQRNIVASKDVRGTVTANFYDVTMREALDAILRSNGFDYREDGNFIYVYTERELAEREKANRRVVTAVFNLYYVQASEAQTLIAQALSSDGKAAVTSASQRGVGASSTDAGGEDHANGNVLLVTDYPENIERVRMILQDLDRRPQQVLVEATILRATLNDDNALGVDFTMLGGVDFRGLAEAGSTPSGALEGAVPDPRRGGITDQGYYGGGTGFTAGVPSGGLRVGFVYNNISAFLSALEQVTDTAVMANPKVLVLNKQRGEVKVIRRDAYRGRVTIDPSGVRTQEVEFQETGTMLIFRPFIGNDGFVRLEIHPEDSSVLASIAPDLPPSQVSTEATTNIIVRDGHTVVIGGLFRESVIASRSQVPFMGNLPVVGPLFRSRSDSTIREEIIILLTPHIIKDDVAYSEASEQQWQNAERLRVGVRKGMMWFGRERLAESHYEKALAELNKPQPSRRKALWYLNGATNLNPKFLEAIELRQSLTGREITSVDNSSIRHFVREQILREQAAPVDAGNEAVLLPMPWDLPLDEPVLPVDLTTGEGAEDLGSTGSPAEHALADCTDLDCPTHALDETVIGTAEAEAIPVEVVELEQAVEAEAVAAEAFDAEEPADAVTVIEMLADDERELPVEQVTIPLD